ncbi:hypothetical protein HY386_00155 [Candidatus Daviesbacteria bacterium]|nr:hypothetical protein [Candidatus Daviesbacteria bacterium]
MDRSAIILLIISSLIFLIIGFTIGVSGIIKTKPFFQTKDTSSAPKLLINPNNNTVINAQVVYLLDGTIQSMVPTTTESGKSTGYQLTLSDPAGVILDNTLIINTQSENIPKTEIVTIDSKGKETPASVSDLQPGKTIKLSYFINLKDSPDVGLVTKVFLPAR